METGTGKVIFNDGAEITGGTNRGIWLFNGTFNMQGGIIWGNKGQNGAGVYVVCYGSSRLGIFNKTGGTIYGNDAADPTKRNTAVGYTVGATTYYGDAVFVYPTSTYSSSESRNTTSDTTHNISAQNGGPFVGF